MTDLIAGHIAMMIPDFGGGLPQLRAGKIRALAVSHNERNSQLPDVPTLNETVMPGFDVLAWAGMFAPAGTPPEAIVDRLAGELQKILSNPDLKAKFVGAGWRRSTAGPQAFDAYVRSELVKWTALDQGGRHRAGVTRIEGGASTRTRPQNVSRMFASVAKTGRNDEGRANGRDKEENIMRRWLVGLLALAMHAGAGSSSRAQDVPEIPFDSVPNFLKLPPDMHLGEVAGVAVNSKGHIFVFSRGGTSAARPTATRPRSSSSSTPDGKYIREIGKNLYAWSFAHTVRIDKDDNIWAIDKGSDMIIKFNPQGGRSRWCSAASRKPPTTTPSRCERPEAAAAGRSTAASASRPTSPGIRQGNIFISDGYINSRVAKYDKNGNWVKSWGERGNGPGQFNTLHTIAADAKGNIYVADRGNRRIQVFDPDGNLSAQIKIDVPFDANTVPAIGNKPDLTNYQQVGGTFAPGAPWALCITPGAEPVAVRLRRLSRPHLQAVARRQGAGRARRVRQAAQAVRLDPRDRVPVREQAVRRRDPELAGAEADAPS